MRTKCVGWLVAAALILPGSALANPAQEAKAAESPAQSAAETPSAQPKPRLRFRSDRRCTCESALGERDIQEAAAAKAAQEQPATRSEK